MKFEQSVLDTIKPQIRELENEGITGYVGRNREPLRTISLNGNMTVARAAYEATVKLFPNNRWILTWGSFVVEDSMPLPLGE